MNLNIFGIAILTVLTQSTAHAGILEQHRHSDLRTKELGCLAGQTWMVDDLRAIGIQAGQRVLIRQERTAIPNVSPARPQVVNFMLTDLSGKRGWLFFFKVEADGDVVIIPNAYRLGRENGRWMASEGNGGLGTYRAIGPYVSKLARQAPLHMTLKSSTQNCRVE